jgi:hypothetical protein
MSDSFDTNLLTQVTAVDRRTGISKEHVSLFQKPKHHDRKKDDSPHEKQSPDGPDEDPDRPGSPEDHEGRIDITV